ncbi:uncharacterized protein SCHCODRAFT_02672714 [Schizophyllum commune H4-8]|uniref:uncharacterized protein n=1 Tax=Schizophyllum commune (strain H4-8 / FGSC 9210) TaxID=578458 RepID=UPI002160A254|nr:uncharacterized protein SCHCODRAFT_02672714 [Schizophyllum commune H4-8]KAI5886546.1 hypothetical protein SCHCODRAFT_02672714 [Schizophyllum commune H4-8]
MPYPRAAIHECLYAPESPSDDGDTTISLTTILASKGCADKPFYHPSAAKKKRVTFDLEASQHARILIEACGLDPKKATFANMESLNVHVKCMSWSCRGRKNFAMGWRAALLHSLKKHRVEDDRPLKSYWEVVKDEWELRRVEHQEVNKPSWGAWSQQHCPISRCKTQIICPSGELDALEWHRAVAHKDLSRATDISMVKDYPEPVNY